MSGTYSFQDVQVSFIGPTGAFSLGAGAGAAEGGITVAAAGDKNTMTVGPDGEVMHTLRADKSGLVTIRLQKTSPFNALLQANYNAQTLDSRLHGKNIITVSQSVAGDIEVCRQCAFKKKPDTAYATAAGEVDWAFDAGKIDTVLGTY